MELVYSSDEEDMLRNLDEPQRAEFDSILQRAYSGKYKAAVDMVSSVLVSRGRNPRFHAHLLLACSESFAEFKIALFWVFFDDRKCCFREFLFLFFIFYFFFLSGFRLLISFRNVCRSFTDDLCWIEEGVFLLSWSDVFMVNFQQ